MQSAQAAGCFYSVLQRAKRMILSVEKLSHSYGVRTLFKDVTFNIEMGDKIGIIGVNGTGKSTLLRDIARGEAGDGGRITANGSCVIEYLPQNPDHDPQATVLEQVFQGDSPQLELLRRYERAAALAAADPENSALQSRLLELQQQMDSAYAWQLESEAKAVLDQLGISDFNQPMAELSGGQRKRVALAGVLVRPSDLLILDEPTNHLDMRSKDVLKEAIREFDGTVILVSHDRDFLDGLATKVYEFGGGTVKEHLGGIYDFLQKKKIDSLNELQKGVSLSTSPTASAKGNEADTEQPSENRLSYEAQKELNKKIKKLERQVADCEASIEETESAIAILEAKMATPEGASDMQLYERHQKLKQQLDTTVEEWERVSMELEEVKN